MSFEIEYQPASDLGLRDLVKPVLEDVNRAVDARDKDIERELGVLLSAGYLSEDIVIQHFVTTGDTHIIVKGELKHVFKGIEVPHIEDGGLAQ